MPTPSPKLEWTQQLGHKYVRAKPRHTKPPPTPEEPITIQDLHEIQQVMKDSLEATKE